LTQRPKRSSCLDAGGFARSAGAGERKRRQELGAVVGLAVELGLAMAIIRQLLGAAERLDVVAELAVEGRWPWSSSPRSPASTWRS
jgi:hypothetical protein